MDDQHKHIEDWLKAAAEQPAPGNTGMEEKRQAWSKMASLLDNAAAAPQPGPSAPDNAATERPPLSKSWFATGRGMLWSLAAAAAVGAATLVIYLQLNKRQAAQNNAVQQVITVPRAGDTLTAAPTQAPADTPAGILSNNNRNNVTNSSRNELNANEINKPALPAAVNSGQPIPDNTAAANPAGNRAAGPQGSNSLPPAVAQQRPLYWWQHSSPLSGQATAAQLPGTGSYPNTKPPVAGDNYVAGNRNANAGNSRPAAESTFGNNNDKATGNASVTAGRNNIKAPAGKNNQSTGRGAGNKPAPPNALQPLQTAHNPGGRNSQAANNIPPGNTLPGRQQLTNNNAAATAKDFTIRPLHTINPFSVKLPALLPGSRNQRVGPAPPMGQRSSGKPIVGGFALQAGFVYPFTPKPVNQFIPSQPNNAASKGGNGYGFKLGAHYSFRIGPNLYLQPMLSAGYFTGWAKSYTHVAINRHTVDSLGQGDYMTDSIVTKYTAKSAFTAGAGLNVSYMLHRWAIGGGLSYQYALPSGIRDTLETHNRVDSLGLAAYSTPAFSKQQLPGMHTLGLQLDVGYYIRPRIQVGASYRLILLRSAGNSGFKKPFQYLQSNSLELYLRIPLQR